MDGYDLSRKQIAVIEDDPLIRRMITMSLGEMGVQSIYPAENGVEGISVVSQYGSTIDLIICDLEMPQMGGLEFLSVLRDKTDAHIANLPVLILTSHIEQEIVQKAVKIGIHAYLKKPLTKVALERRVIRALTSGPIDPRRLKR